MSKPMSAKIINWIFYTCSLLLVGVILLMITQGMDVILDYIIYVAILFIAWWISMFLKLKLDNDQRRDRVKNYKERLKDRL
ncbi:MAG: hypothetical protein ACRC9P_01400 [Bacteroides sp.]